MNIIGISAFYHDSAACLVVDGDIIAAAQEERFSRIKHDAAFPSNSLKYCLHEGHITIDDIDYIVFYDKPFLKFERLFETYLAFAPKGFTGFLQSFPIWLKYKLFKKKVIIDYLESVLSRDVNWEKKILFSEHHFSHASSAFFPSPFHDAAVLTMDGVGEWVTTSLASGSGNSLSVEREINFPHSLGLLYSAFTSFTGFKVNSGEYKVMGLAPYGNPKYVKIIKDNLIDIKEDGSFRLDMSYFNYCTGLTMTNSKFNKLFEGKPRTSEGVITQREMDLAASIQCVTEEVVIKLARDIRKSTNHKNLCLAGGVALNCVANGKLLKENIFESIWIQPASGDAGGAIGAALGAYHVALDLPRKANIKDIMNGSFLGPYYEQKEIEKCLTALGANYITYDEDDVIAHTATELANGKAIGWHQGRMEFGPRALGARSIIADARSHHIQKDLNLKVKYRESFRPFAPSVLREFVNNWFEFEIDSPYMLFVADIKKNKQFEMSKEQQRLFGIDKLNIPRSPIPAVTHVDYSARIQTVGPDTNQKFHKLISKFYEITGCPVLVNTSFNVRGEPIVNTPEDAFNCFMGTDLDILTIGNCILRKENQDISLIKDYKSKYDLD
jgi:carbamoyltransferase